MKIEKLQTISPINGEIYYETIYDSVNKIQNSLSKATNSQSDWVKTSLEKRIDFCNQFLNCFKAKQDILAEEISWQMGRPKHQAAGEINGVIERSEYMMSCAESALTDIQLPEKKGFKRFIRKQPLGVVFVIAPWNYPYLTAINTIIPALLAGNTVILKHASQTVRCAERLNESFAEAGFPAGVFQHLNLTHKDAENLMLDSAVRFVAFTGSVSSGARIQQQLGKKFIGIGLELGGKDAAYVREDADLSYTIENLVDGAMFNSGQSCCGIERIYVARSKYDAFVSGYCDLVNQYTLGNPLDKKTNLGPVVNTQSANSIRAQIQSAVKAGATALIDTEKFKRDVGNDAYLAPQVLVNVNHQMDFMSAETFGPAVGIMPVDDDTHALQLMNDSEFGLTGSIWTADSDTAIDLGNHAEVGTWFMNRCDYLDPALAWTGVKDTGRGITLSALGYDQLTQKKSFHLKTEV